jgi:hypothetical protein
MTTRKLLLGTAAALALAISPVIANCALANQLGDLIASEQVCHLVGRFINENVEVSDIDLTEQLTLVVRAARTLVRHIFGFSL